jgi:hypothetical protein
MRSTITRIFYAVIVLLVGLSLQLGGCQKKLVHVERDGAVEGFVKDSLTLIPIVGADVFLDDDPFPFPKTDSTGYYLVFKLTGAPISVKITIKAQGYKTQDKNIIIKPNSKS